MRSTNPLHPIYKMPGHSVNGITSEINNRFGFKENTGSSLTRNSKFQETGEAVMYNHAKSTAQKLDKFIS